MVISKSKKRYLRDYSQENSKTQRELGLKLNKFSRKLKVSRTISFSVKKD